MRRLGLLVPVALVTLAATACGGGGEAEPASPPAPATETAPAQDAGGSSRRDRSFEVALGEWAVTPEAKAIRPGRTTFVIVNRGTMQHGFEIEREDVEDDASKVETGLLQPGESVEVELSLEAGIYKLECTVEGHDDMGMETLLEVSPKAPAAAKQGAGRKKRAAVAIEAFAFSPATITARVGQTVTWKNRDPAEHTVTADGGGFDSGTMAQGASFKATFDNPGEYRYVCALHPGMTGTVVVRG